MQIRYKNGDLQINNQRDLETNKNALTGPANCKKTTRYYAYIHHYVQNRGKLMIQSRENSQKPQFGQFFNDLEVKYLQIGNFSEKQVAFKLKVIFSTNFRSKTKIIVRAVFEKNIKVSCKKSDKPLEPFLRKLRYQPTNQPNIKVSDFGLIWRPFGEYLQINNFFQKSGTVTFVPLQSLISCKKSGKSLEPFLRKLRYQLTNQPTNYYQQHRSFRKSLTLVSP